MDDNDRVIELMRVLNMTSRQLATEIGVQPSTISNIVARRNRPSLEFLQKVSVAFPEISSDWLFLGKGSIYAQKSDSQRLMEFDEDDVTSSQSALSDGPTVTENMRTDRNGGVKPVQAGTKNSAESQQSQFFVAQAPQVDMATAVRDRKIKKVIILFDDGMYDVFDPSAS